MASSSHTITLVPDYHQFYLRDAGSGPDPNDDGWTQREYEDRLHVTRHAIDVGTASEVRVKVEVVVGADAPDGAGDLLSAWDHVTECGIEVPSGELVVAGCTEYVETAARVNVAPGAYRARVFYGGFDTVDEGGFDGRDHYRVVLWPGEPRPPRVLKRYATPAAPEPDLTAAPPAEVPPEVTVWVASEIARFASPDAPPTALRAMAASIGALPLVYDPAEDRGGCVAVTPSGHVVQFLVRDDPKNFRVIDDANLRACYLKLGSDRHPELAPLVPERPADAVTCLFCGGAGVQRMAPGAPCVCGGLGWRYPPS